MAGPTLPADFSFSPKVWQDHIAAFFRRKLVFGSMAMQVSDLESKPGTSINFPYFKSIGDAEEPAAADALQVDKLSDDAFSATVKEIGKAVGIRKSALMVSAAEQSRIFSEVQSQLARVHAEKVDKDIMTELSLTSSYQNGFTSASSAETMTIKRLLQGKINAFGDLHDQAVAVFMHSQHYLDLMSDSSSGFLQANAVSPFQGINGYMGKILDMALIVSDNVQENATIGGKRAFSSFIMKANPYGLVTKQAADMEYDYDMLNREHVFAATQWYAVKSFHAKISSLDYKVARLNVVTQL